MVCIDNNLVEALAFLGTFLYFIWTNFRSDFFNFNTTVSLNETTFLHNGHNPLPRGIRTVPRACELLILISMHSKQKTCPHEVTVATSTLSKHMGHWISASFFTVLWSAAVVEDDTLLPLSSLLLLVFVSWFCGLSIRSWVIFLNSRISISSSVSVSESIVITLDDIGVCVWCIEDTIAV